MKLICSSCTPLYQEPTLVGALKFIELVGRTCYKSEDKITNDSYINFVEGLKKRKHYAMLEHGTVFLEIPYADTTNLNIIKELAKDSAKGHWIQIRPNHTHVRVTTNLRVVIENGLEDLLDLYWPKEFDQEKWPMRFTFKFILSRGIANEFVRHRVFSFAQESTRYCNYTLGKFGGDMLFILPEWAKNFDMGPNRNPAYDLFVNTCMDSEKVYNQLMSMKVGDRDMKPQEAREVLPLCLKTELVMTGFESDWNNSFLRQRYFEKTGPAHPDAKVLAEEVYQGLSNIHNL